MNAILLTVFVGFLLVGLFLVMFFHYRRGAGSAGAEHESLLPLNDERPVPAAGSTERRTRPGAPRHSP